MWRPSRIAWRSVSPSILTGSGLSRYLHLGMMPKFHETDLSKNLFMNPKESKAPDFDYFFTKLVATLR